MSDPTNELFPLTVEELADLHHGLREQQLTVLKGLNDRVTHRTLPSCPRCRAVPTTITQVHRNAPEVELAFSDCGHRFLANEETTLTFFRGPRRQTVRDHQP
ncbi:MULTISPECIES: hypothetical protein [unclassified Streptomyces]|uniref:hypothetical protein n=1 Tax=unclassified Streptomyces TaxID=2593676 RepID=UPI0035DE4C40